MTYKKLTLKWRNKKMKIKFATFNKVNQFVKMASNFEGDVLIKSGRYVINGKSLMGVYSLDLTQNLEIEFVEKSIGEENKFIEKLKEVDILA